MPDPLHVVVDDDTETIRVDPETGTVETDQPDGGVVVQLDARKAKDGEDSDEDKWFANLADDVAPIRLGQLTNELMDSISADDRSRQDSLDNHARGLGLLGIKLEQPRSGVGDSSSSIEGMSTVTNPLLLEACLKGWANDQAELLPSNGPVKIKDDGDETVAEDDLAESYERDWNHWFTATAKEYYPDTSHMLLWGTRFKGKGFKKVYRCPIRRRPVSESVDAKDLIVSDTTKSLGSCGRITHQIPMRPSVMKRMKFIGAYRDVALTQPTPTINAVDSKIGSIQGTAPTKDRPEDQEYTIWECQCELDLDDFVPAHSQYKGEGIPLPYLVTIDKDSREILALRRDWEEDDEECKRLELYTEYPFVPGPGFYGTGLLNILGNASAAMTAAWRLALDTGMFANFPGGLISKLGTRQNTSDIRIGPGQWPAIETNGMPINQVVFPNPYKDVTPGLMAMMDKITQQAGAAGGTVDVPTAEGIQNVPVGTMLAQIEQATKVESAVHRGLHTAQSNELSLLKKLFRRHPEDFWRTNEVAPKNYWTEEKFLQALDDINLVPVSDPNVPSHIHRVAKGVALVQLMSNPVFAPHFNIGEGLKRVMAVLREDTNGLLVDPPPMPQGGPQQDPAKMITAQAAMKNAETKAQEAGVKAQEGATDQQLSAMKVQTEKEIANTELQREVVIHAHDAFKEQNQQQHDQAMDVAQHGLAQQQHASETAQADREHGLNVATAAHDMAMDHKEHDLAVKEANKPQPKPKPAAPAKKK